MSIKNACIILPTYNEAENVSVLIPQIFEQQSQIQSHHLVIIVVDDRSPDGTGQIVKSLKKDYPDLHLLEDKDNGLGEAYIKGMKYAIDNNVMVTIGSLPIIEEYTKLGGSNDISIRVNPDIGFGHHDHCITGGPKSKFGIYFNQMDKAREMTSRHGLNIKG